MGFFSWECAVSKKDIMNRHTRQGATHCVLVCPDDSIIEEDDYDGYGVFGGRDAYDLLAFWNNPDLVDDPDAQGQNDWQYRDEGIMLHFSDKPIPFPLKFVLREHYSGQKYSELGASGDAEGQGFWKSTKR